ncbi:MAG: tRNA-dependent cyclodipeptide synthase [Patescibacteria group bacterium]
MRIEQVFGTTIGDIENHKFNAFLGISIENKYFSKESISQYVRWMDMVSKDAILILIADEIQAINYQVLGGMEAGAAVRRAEERGLEMARIVQIAVEEMEGELTHPIHICRWVDVKGEDYKRALEVITDYWHSNQEFREHIVKNVKKNLGSRSKTLFAQQLNELSRYLLDELAVVLGGIVIDQTVFNLNPYPGLGTCQLFADLQSGLLFPVLTKALKIKHPVAMVEAYAE